MDVVSKSVRCGAVSLGGLGMLGLYFQALGLRAKWARTIFPGLLVVVLLGPSLRVPPADQYVMQLFRSSLCVASRHGLGRTADSQAC